ncbi:MAG: hypothetical protein RIR45_1134 [Pseudomonadota bacterium]|jgi:uncharacterized membrane protein YesL
MNNFLKANCIVLYTLALASLLVTMPWDAGPILQKVALIMVALHVLEAVFAFKFIKTYQGPLVKSLALALLFGVLHWMPLARASRMGKAS